MGKQVIYNRFSRIRDMLEDAKVVADDETVAELREQTDALEAAYLEVFEDGE